MTTPPDFGGREIEEGILEDLGGPAEDHPAGPEGGPGDRGIAWEDNELHAPGRVCARCGADITPGQDVRRRADGTWIHEICP